MSLLAPGALWALLALAVPLALHLRRRRVGRTIPVGSIRHLESLPTAERRGLRLQDRWLLLLRALIVTTLAVLLARPVLDHPPSNAAPFALVDRSAPPALIDSLRSIATVSAEPLDDPWRRVQEVDDSLPAGVPLLVAASPSSDRYAGPRPTVARRVEWITAGSTQRPIRSNPPTTQHPIPDTPLERRALAAAVAAAAEEFGPLNDSAGWIGRLPDWWRDSLAVPAFPLGVARGVAPVRAAPATVTLTAGQVTPRLVVRPVRAADAIDLHWWFWGAALLLFTLERLVAWRRRMGA
ncbi:MAG TPA: BatA domain-containing protein [Gemmatimonadales bacterium]|nr:BatA domain-containing protein [Gemmatimonadales bacterium]